MDLSKEELKEAKEIGDILRCYDEECDYDLNDLGSDAWLTGCPLCGSSSPRCGRTKEEAERIDKELGEESDETNTTV